MSSTFLDEFRSLRYNRGLELPTLASVGRGLPVNPGNSRPDRSSPGAGTARRIHSIRTGIRAKRHPSHADGMTRRTPLPADLTDRPFSTTEARAHGVSPGRLSANDLVTPFSRVRMPASHPQEGRNVFETHRDLTRQLCRAYALRMPQDAFFCGPTAALLHGIPIPTMPAEIPALHVGLPKNTRAVHIVGVSGHSYDIHPDEVIVRDGCRLTSLERTWCDLARTLALGDLVAAGDWLIYWRSARTNLARLAAAVAGYSSQRGVKKLRLAFTLLNGHAESPRESRLRVEIVLAGLPNPEVNVELFDSHGVFLARADLLFRAFGLILEYEGLQHLTDRAQWQRDIDRTHALEDEGWRIIRVTAEDLRDPRRLIERIRRHIASRVAQSRGL